MQKGRPLPARLPERVGSLELTAGRRRGPRGFGARGFVPAAAMPESRDRQRARGPSP